MNRIAETARKSLPGRHRAEVRFRVYAVSAVVLAALFLLVFLADICSVGAPALRQAQVLATVQYNRDSMDNPALAVDEELEELVSRGVLRLLPQQMRDNPALLGTEKQQWLLASADVDQLLKGKAQRLRPGQVAEVRRLEQEGKVRLAFNSGFFTRGDSKLPELAGIWACAVGSAYVLLLTFVFSFPVGVLSAVYLEEFAPDNWLTRLIEVNINNLAAIPSIIYGLLGLAIFINFFHVPRSSALVGGLTMALGHMPIIIIATRAALRSVPGSIREAAFGLGATPWQVVWHHTLPLAMPGVLTGTIIAMAQAIGETAPLLIVGMVAYIPDAPTSVTTAASVLPAQIYTWSTDSQRAFEERTALGIVMLLVIMLSMNALAIYLRNRSERKW